MQLWVFPRPQGIRVRKGVCMNSHAGVHLKVLHFPFLFRHISTTLTVEVLRMTTLCRQTMHTVKGGLGTQLQFCDMFSVDQKKFYLRNNVQFKLLHILSSIETCFFMSAKCSSVKTFLVWHPCM